MGVPLAYYNAGSAALVLVLLFLIIGTFLWCRVRRKNVRLPIRNIEEAEESIPLNSDLGISHEDGDEGGFKQRKGKEREILTEPSPPPYSTWETAMRKMATKGGNDGSGRTFTLFGRTVRSHKTLMLLFKRVDSQYPPKKQYIK
jgi:hypothetical protein